MRLERPVRDVQAFLSSRGGVRPYALTLVDFEPTGSEPLTFVSDVPDSALPPRFAAAFGEGVLGKLRSWSFKGVPPYALRVRLRDARWREGESTEAGFAWAGSNAAREFDRCVNKGLPPRPYLAQQPHGDRDFDAIRDVHIRRVIPSACGVFAIATADFEPLATEDGLLFEFACELPDSRLPHEYADAFERGVRDILYGNTNQPVAAFRVRLHDAKWHEVDSNEAVFADAGRRAATEALRRHGSAGRPDTGGRTGADA
jgi:hypothetical protein